MKVRYPTEFMSEAELEAKYGDPWNQHGREAMWFGVLLVAAILARWCWIRWRKK